MIKEYSIAEARNQFAAIVHDLKTTPSIQLTRRGKPVAMLLTIEEYERLAAGRAGFWDNYQAFCNTVDLAKMDIDPAIFGGLRDPSPGFCPILRA
ncbi:MAG TPA: type II toxin-antitoxin system Phd/YefM family antitoxin [Anaerolineae bacterium]|nr:type II toxin-antitoxin system Phd/YefM family antitoxin [Anaerolineae bacterium]